MNTKTFAIGIKKFTIALLAICAMGIVSQPTKADEAVGQDSSQTAAISSVSSILDNPAEGQEAILRGQIISQQSEEKDYLFTDGTGEIVIQISENNFSYDPEVTVEITGVINFESQHLEEAAQDPTPEDIQFDVNRIQILTANN